MNVLEDDAVSIKEHPRFCESFCTWKVWKVAGYAMLVGFSYQMPGVLFDPLELSINLLNPIKQILLLQQLEVIGLIQIVLIHIGMAYLIALEVF